MCSHMQTQLSAGLVDICFDNETSWMQVMVSESGVYNGDLGQRSSETMPFSRFLRAAQAANGCAPQHLYLAQASFHSIATHAQSVECFPQSHKCLQHNAAESS